MTAWSRLSRYALVFVGAVSIPFSASAACKHVKCSPDLDAATTDTVPVIVQYVSDPSDAEVTAVSSLGSVSNRMHSVKAIAAKISATQLTALASRPGVAYVSLDRPVKARQQTVVPIGTTPEFTAEPINAPWAIAQGFYGQVLGLRSSTAASL